MIKHYYGIFTKTKEAVEVEIPDIKGCFTFGKDFEEAYEMAKDALAACLASGEPQFINTKPTTFEELSEIYKAKNQTISPVPVDETIMHAYAPKKRINVVFPSDLLSKIDETRGKIGERDRSKFISDVMREYIQIS